MTIERVISVIIVNFNGGRWLTDCVRSVLASTVPVIVYVIDNASEDDSITYLQQILINNKYVKIIKNTSNLGFARAANLALPYVKSQYVVFLNPDCFIYPDTFAHFADMLDRYPKAGMIGGLVRNLDGSEQAGCRRSIPTPWRAMVRVFHLDKWFPNSSYFKSFVLTRQPLPDHVIEIEGISGACMFVRWQALKSVGPMDEEYFLHCEDLDWFMRFRALKWQILFAPTIEIVHVKGGCSRDRPFWILWYKHKSMIRFYRKFFRHQYPTFLIWLISVAVWIRFSVLALITLFHKNK